MGAGSKAGPVAGWGPVGGAGVTGPVGGAGVTGPVGGQPRMRRRTKWLLGLAVTLLVVPPLVVGGLFLYAVKQSGGTAPRAVACERAMKAIGWRLPPGADGGSCTEHADTLFPSQWTGTFRMPRAEVAAWLEARPEERYSSHTYETESLDGPEGSLHARLTYPDSPNFGNRDIDAVTVDFTADGPDHALVAFHTYPG
ncbi:hypothetical protein K7B06_16175 [Streptomyces erythrochromogenes]|nr:hypothetical protein [Streptomyces erythrochromogenes]